MQTQQVLQTVTQLLEARNNKRIFPVSIATADVQRACGYDVRPHLNALYKAGAIKVYPGMHGKRIYIDTFDVTATEQQAQPLAKMERLPSIYGRAAQK